MNRKVDAFVEQGLLDLFRKDTDSAVLVEWPGTLIAARRNWNQFNRVPGLDKASGNPIRLPSREFTVSCSQS